MKKNKKQRKISKNAHRAERILRKIEKVVRYYRYDRDYKHLFELTEGVISDRFPKIGYISWACAYHNSTDNCSGCTKELEKYCTEDIAPMDWN